MHNAKHVRVIGGTPVLTSKIVLETFGTIMVSLNVNDKSMTTSEHNQNDFVKSLSLFRLF